MVNLSQKEIVYDMAVVNKGAFYEYGQSCECFARLDWTKRQVVYCVS